MAGVDVKQISEIKDRPAFVESVTYHGSTVVIGTDDLKIFSPFWWAVDLSRRLSVEVRSESGIQARQLAVEAANEFLPGGVLHNLVRQAYEFTQHHMTEMMTIEKDWWRRWRTNSEGDLVRREVEVVFGIRLLLECLVPDPDDIDFADLIAAVDESLADCGPVMLFFAPWGDQEIVDQIGLELLIDSGAWWGWLAKNYQTMPRFLLRSDLD
ncbi:MAG: hypothetical protein V1716_00295 [Candidatus Uhrbacteria bacterium]